MRVRRRRWSRRRGRGSWPPCLRYVCRCLCRYIGAEIHVCMCMGGSVCVSMCLGVRPSVYATLFPETHTLSLRYIDARVTGLRQAVSRESFTWQVAFADMLTQIVHHRSRRRQATRQLWRRSRWRGSPPTRPSSCLRKVRGLCMSGVGGTSHRKHARGVMMTSAREHRISISQNAVWCFAGACTDRLTDVVPPCAFHFHSQRRALLTHCLWRPGLLTAPRTRPA